MAMKKFHGSFANALIEGLCFLLVGWGRDIVAAQGTGCIVLKKVDLGSVNN